MRRHFPFLLLIAALLLSACTAPAPPPGPAAPTATASVPTEATAAQPTSAPAAEPAAAPAVEATPAEGSALPVEALKNATYSGIYDKPVIHADCNQVNAEYTLGAGGAMTITPGPATLVACPEGSLGERFVQLLGKTASFQTNNKALGLFAADGSAMLFNIVEGAESE